MDTGALTRAFPVVRDDAHSCRASIRARTGLGDGGTGHCHACAGLDCGDARRLDRWTAHRSARCWHRGLLSTRHRWLRRHTARAECIGPRLLDRHSALRTRFWSDSCRRPSWSVHPTRDRSRCVPHPIRRIGHGGSHRPRGLPASDGLVRGRRCGGGLPLRRSSCGCHLAQRVRRRRTAGVARRDRRHARAAAAARTPRRLSR
jgi:hypothetical protein